MTASLHCAACGAAAAPGAARCDYCRARLATLACPSCLALSGPDARHCTQCGARVARDDGERVEGAAPRPCPACRAPLRPVVVGTLAVEECPACDGLWLAAADFERLCADQEAQAAVLHQAPLAAPAGGRTALPPVRYRPCPACGAMMNRHNFGRASGVVLDVCRPHGTFFDRAELHGVVRFIRGGGLERARERQLERLAEEERRARARELGAGASTAMRPTPTTVRDLSPGVTLDLGTLLRLFAGG